MLLQLNLNLVVQTGNSSEDDRGDRRWRRYLATAIDVARLLDAIAALFENHPYTAEVLFWLMCALIRNIHMLTGWIYDSFIHTPDPKIILVLAQSIPLLT